MKHSRIFGLMALALWLGPTPRLFAQQAVGATFGDTIALPGGTPSDVVLDELRGRLYLINKNTSLVYIFDYTTSQVVGKVQVDSTPLAGAMSMDGRWLYVTCYGPSTLDVIDLSPGTPGVVQHVVLPSKPQGVEVGNDGRVLVSMIGTGVVSGVPQNTLAVYDPGIATGQQLLPVAVPALPTTPSPLPPVTLPRPTTAFSGKLLRTPDGQFIIGVITPSNFSTYLFVYEVASGVVLRNRTVSGASAWLSVAPDGSRFMAGSTMYDTATLAIIAQENAANAPFLTNAFNNTANYGGSIFSADGATVYAAFNQAGNTVPPSPSLSSTLLVNDPANLGIRLGIKLPESIVAKMVMKSDGSEAWGLSDSGLLHLPLAHLYDYPILVPETTQVFLAMDECNRGVASGTLKIGNAGKGKLTFSVATNTGSALVYNMSSGLAPASITFTMEPGRTGVSRQPGTNIWTNAGTSQGTPFNVTLASPDAINIPNTIRVYMNYRQSDQRGVIYPVPTTPNNSPGGIGGYPGGTGNEGLQDLVLDEARRKLYIANSGYNRIEVFDLDKQHFVNPIPVGQMPHQMAMGTDGNTLYVANTGGESIGIVDLDMGRVVDSVIFPPIPRNGTANPIYPRSMAMGLAGLEFLMSNGTQWKVVGNTAMPRPLDSVMTSATLSGCPACGMIATPGSEYILTLNGSGQAYVYDATADVYIASRLLFTSPIQGYYGALGAGPAGSYFLGNGLIVNPSLTTIGGAASPSAAGQRNVAAVAPLSATSFLRLTTPVRSSITATTRDDPRTTLEMVNVATGDKSLMGVIPENPVVNVFGSTRFNTNPRTMVVDSAATTAYAITLSGLSVISLAPAGNDTRPAIAAGGVVTSADGTTNFSPGSFVTIAGKNLAATAAADTIPPPTVLGGSCVTFGNISVPLLATSDGQIQAQIPDNLIPGTQVVEVRSLATAQASDPVAISVRPGSSSTSTNPHPQARETGGFLRGR